MDRINAVETDAQPKRKKVRKRWLIVAVTAATVATEVAAEAGLIPAGAHDLLRAAARLLGLV